MGCEGVAIPSAAAAAEGAFACLWALGIWCAEEEEGSDAA